MGKLKIAHKIAEVFDNLVKGQEKDENLWGLFVETFQKLNNSPPTTYNLQLLYHYFLWNFLSILGYELQIYNCALCQKKLEPQKLFFSPRDGGIICQNHDKELKLTKETNTETIKILRLILKKDWPILAKLKTDKSNLKSLNKITNEF